MSRMSSVSLALVLSVGTVVMAIEIGRRLHQLAQEAGRQERPRADIPSAICRIQGDVSRHSAAINCLRDTQGASDATEAARANPSALDEETIREHQNLVQWRRRAADDLFSTGLPEVPATGPSDLAALRWTYPYRPDGKRKLVDALWSRLTSDERYILGEDDRVSVVRIHAHATSEGPDPVTVLWFWTDDDRNMRVALTARDMAILGEPGLRVTPSAARYPLDEAAQ